MAQIWTEVPAVSGELVWIGPAQSLREAAQVMKQRHVSSVLVGVPGEFPAILTERDIAWAVADGRPLDSPVGEAAMSAPVTIDVSATVSDAAARMLDHDMRHLVITRDDQPVGIISARDAVGALLAAADAPMLVQLMRRCVTTHSEVWLG